MSFENLEKCLESYKKHKPIIIHTYLKSEHPLTVSPELVRPCGDTYSLEFAIIPNVIK